MLLLLLLHCMVQIQEKVRYESLLSRVVTFYTFSHRRSVLILTLVQSDLISGGEPFLTFKYKHTQLLLLLLLIIK